MRRSPHPPSRLVLSKELRIDCIDGRKVVHVFQEDLVVESVQHSTAGTGQRMRTVVLTIFPTSLPLASTTFFRFCSAWRACASTPPSTNAPDFGSKPRQPDTKTIGGHTIAWLYGPIAAGASAYRRIKTSKFKGNVLTFGRDFGERGMGRHAGHAASGY